MKALVVYYSRTGHTKKAAEAITRALACDSEEIIDTQKRSGPLGFLRSGYQAMMGKLTVIRDIKKDISSYDILVIGTPIWASTVSTPLRTFIHQYREQFKKVAFFCTCGGTRIEKVFSVMEELCGKKPVSVFSLRTMEVREGDYTEKVKKFADKIKKVR